MTLICGCLRFLSSSRWKMKGFNGYLLHVLCFYCRRVLHPREAEPKRRYGRFSGGQLCGRRPKEEEAAAAAEDAFHQPAAARTRGHFCQK
ncbi:hypothetical protein TNCT_151211 [Trichonephila clavata]|uniref:Uncharacterized protein n=1 Tax=Trichonephila clavata TaxID=2740835 RepID=A0A8X6EWW1_TRICU|nr:hypothetical protein TNCT_151211 [Trichonephila clavata]